MSARGELLLFLLASLCVALGFTLFLMPKFIRYMHAHHMEQTIYELGPKAHQKKKGTPNMGGVVFSIATLFVLIVFSVFFSVTGKTAVSFFNLNNVLFPLIWISVGSMMIGFLDDYIKDIKKRHEGLTPKQKIILQFVIGAVFSVYAYFYCGSKIWVPFSGAEWDLGLFYIPLITLLVIFMTNSANLQDGVDGILSSVTIVGLLAFAAISVFSEADQLYSVMTAALMGACIGFLHFNRYPAKIFMGDTGSMFIGGTMVGLAVLMKIEILLLLICFTSVMSSVSVMMQVLYFKWTHGKRIFKMTPIHHHFELSGMKENRIVLMYVCVTAVLSAVAVLSVRFLF